MKKIVLTTTLALALTSVSAFAEDPLKNSLMPGKQEQIAPDLDALKVAAPQAASRPADAVIATVDGAPIVKKDADKFLALASKGQAMDIDQLPAKQKEALIQGLAASKLIEMKSQKEVPEDIKNKLAARYWAEQEIMKIKVDEKEAKAFYEKNKSAFKDKEGKELSFEKVAKYVEMQLKQKKFNDALMKNAKVVIK